MLHDLKIEQKYADRILKESRTFDVRFNNQDFQVNDQIQYHVVKGVINEDHHRLNKKLFDIKYVYAGEGLKPGWVILGLSEIFERP